MNLGPAVLGAYAANAAALAMRVSVCDKIMGQLCQVRVTPEVEKWTSAAQELVRLSCSLHKLPEFLPERFVLDVKMLLTAVQQHLCSKIFGQAWCHMRQDSPAT